MRTKHLGGCVPGVRQRQHGGSVGHAGGQRHRRVAADERVPLAGGRRPRGRGARARARLQREAEVRGGLLALAGRAARREGHGYGHGRRQVVSSRGGRWCRERREAGVGNRMGMGVPLRNASQLVCS